MSPGVDRAAVVGQVGKEWADERVGWLTPGHWPTCHWLTAFWPPAEKAI
jgi:hypothetical protein